MGNSFLYIGPCCYAVAFTVATADGIWELRCVLHIAIGRRLLRADEATLRSVESTLQRGILVSAVLLPAADLHQHAEDVVGIRTLDGGGVFTEALCPDLDCANGGALNGSGAIATRELIAAQETATLGQVHENCPIPSDEAYHPAEQHTAVH